MKNISFLLTTRQFRDRTKDVTRRLGWQHLQPGTKLGGVVKCMGLKAGETVEKLGIIEIVSVSREPLQALLDDPEYGRQEAIREGFPDLGGAGFVDLFCRSQKCRPATEVTRIEFRYIEPPAASSSLFPDLP